MALNTAGFIDGSTIKGETLRRALYASTAGATGITRATDFAVTAYPTPGAGVWVNRGGGVIATTFSDSDPGQSYAVSNGASFQLPVPANDSAATKTWHVIVRVKDPQYAGESIPDAPATDAYSEVELVSSLPTGKPHLHLATLRIPARTGVVQTSYIEDMRKLALPRSTRYLKSIAITTPDPLDATSSYEQWPDQAIWRIAVPEWATEARVVMQWYNVASMPGNNHSELSVNLGFGRSDNRVLNSTHMVVGFSSPSGGTQEQRRQNTGVADTIKIPAGWRGESITVLGWAKKHSGSVNLIADQWAACSLDIQWVEEPEAERNN